MVWGLLSLFINLQSTSYAVEAVAKTAKKNPSSSVKPGLSSFHFSAPGTVRLQLAAKGKALLPVVISLQASAGTKAVAAELAEYLQRISGATFDVKSGDGTSGIVLGTLAEFPHPGLAKPLEIRRTYDGKEAYAIRTEPKRLLLIGATDLGVCHAAFRFLEA